MAEPPEIDVDAAAAHDDDDGVDVTLIRWMLSLTLEQRLDVLQSFIDSIAELTAEPAPPGPTSPCRPPRRASRTTPARSS